MISSCVVGYNETSTTYTIYIIAQLKTLVIQDVKYDEKVRSSSSQISPSLIERSEEVVFLYIDSKVKEESNIGVYKVRLGVDIPHHLL
jgi:hypothetical protein